VHRSTCVAFCVLCLGAIACCGHAEAQSLSDTAVAASGWQNSAERVGAWQTAVAPEAEAVTPQAEMAAPEAEAATSQAGAVAARDPLWAVHLSKTAEEAFRTASITSSTSKKKPEAARRPRLTGLASYYGQGEVTATGEKFDPNGLTAAHRTLPFGTRVRVTRVDTGNSVVVRINDRGPFKPNRIIDLSEGAAEDLDMTKVGLAEVRLDVLGR
jgi:rare lipoprotein A